MLTPKTKQDLLNATLAGIKASEEQSKPFIVRDKETHELRPATAFFAYVQGYYVSDILWAVGELKRIGDISEAKRGFFEAAKSEDYVKPVHTTPLNLEPGATAQQAPAPASDSAPVKESLDTPGRPSLMPDSPPLPAEPLKPPTPLPNTAKEGESPTEPHQSPNTPYQQYKEPESMLTDIELAQRILSILHAVPEGALATSKGSEIEYDILYLLVNYDQRTNLYMVQKVVRAMVQAGDVFSPKPNTLKAVRGEEE